MDAERELCAWPRGDAGRTVARIGTYHGRRYVDLRRFFRAEDGSWLPTKQGVTLNLE